MTEGGLKHLKLCYLSIGPVCTMTSYMYKFSGWLSFIQWGFCWRRSLLEQLYNYLFNVFFVPCCAPYKGYKEHNHCHQQNRKKCNLKITTLDCFFFNGTYIVFNVKVRLDKVKIYLVWSREEPSSKRRQMKGIACGPNVVTIWVHLNQNDEIVKKKI